MNSHFNRKVHLPDGTSWHLEFTDEFVKMWESDPEASTWSAGRTYRFSYINWQLFKGLING